MPLLKIETTATLDERQAPRVLRLLSQAVADALGKPEQYVMVVISPARIMMAGLPGRAAFLDLRSIGNLSPQINRQVMEKLSPLIQEFFQADPARIYANFTDVPATDWGWQTATFG